MINRIGTKNIKMNKMMFAHMKNSANLEKVEIQHENYIIKYSMFMKLGYFLFHFLAED